MDGVELDLKLGRQRRWQFTFDFLCGLGAGIEDRALPGDVEVGFDSHSCWGSRKVFD